MSLADRKFFASSKSQAQRRLPFGPQAFVYLPSVVCLKKTRRQFFPVLSLLLLICADNSDQEKFQGYCIKQIAADSQREKTHRLEDSLGVPSILQDHFYFFPMSIISL